MIILCSEMRKIQNRYTGFGENLQQKSAKNCGAVGK